MKTSLAINGVSYELDADPRTTLLDGLRNHLGLTGAKKGATTVNAVLVPLSQLSPDQFLPDAGLHA